MRAYGEALIQEPRPALGRVVTERSPLIGSYFFALSGDNLRVEPHSQQEKKYFCLARRLGHGDRGDAGRKNRGVVWPVH